MERRQSSMKLNNWDIDIVATDFQKQHRKNNSFARSLFSTQYIFFHSSVCNCLYFFRSFAFDRLFDLFIWSVCLHGFSLDVSRDANAKMWYSFDCMRFRINSSDKKIFAAQTRSTGYDSIIYQYFSVFFLWLILCVSAFVVLRLHFISAHNDGDDGWSGSSVRTLVVDDLTIFCPAKCFKIFTSFLSSSSLSMVPSVILYGFRRNIERHMSHVAHRSAFANKATQVTTKYWMFKQTYISILRFTVIHRPPKRTSVCVFGQRVRAHNGAWAHHLQTSSLSVRLLCIFISDVFFSSISVDRRNARGWRNGFAPRYLLDVHISICINLERKRGSEKKSKHRSNGTCRQRVSSSRSSKTTTVHKTHLSS